MIRTLLVLLATPAFLITPVLTICHHGETGHLEFLGHCHASAPAGPAATPSCGCDHGCHARVREGRDPSTPESMGAPHLAHVRLRGNDAASFGPRFDPLPLKTATIAPAAWELPSPSEATGTGFRGREPPRAPPLILLTRSLLL